MVKETNSIALISFPKFLFAYILIFLIVLLLGDLMDREEIILGRKYLLALVIYLLMFYKTIKWLSNRTKIGIAAVIMVPFCFIMSYGLFFIVMLITTYRTLGQMSGYRISLIASHILYISGWIFIINLIEKLLNTSHQRRFVYAFVSVVFTIGLSICFNIIGGLEKYLAPYTPGRFHNNLLFILIEFLFLLSALVIFIESYSENNILTILALALLILFFSLTPVGMHTLDRMKYDFIFLGPSLLFLVISVERICKRFYIHLKKEEVQKC
jgi:hypothetical protein